ncbi:MAG: hypothetical protein B6241_02455 [Spirochaetaceae bacterium 4572_59]|nr:MAG: hypothetical protein B6241_02455 [Spirochaetaceae bacterium 4572_59]
MNNNLFKDLFNPVVYEHGQFLRQMQELCKLSHSLLMSCQKEIQTQMSTETLARRLDDKLQDMGKGQYRLEHIHISVNEQAFHCPPGNRLLVSGDIFTLDIVLSDGELFSDGAWSYGVDEISPQRSSLLKDAWAVSCLAARSLIPGEPLSEMQKELGAFLEGHSCQIVPEACGHGIGRKIHDDPEISFISDDSFTCLCPENGCVTVEPVLIGLGDKVLYVKDLGYIAAGGSDTAYFEHVIHTGPDGAICLNIPEINFTECIDIF